ncbi:hypothetical protein RBU61_08330 [Tissierella sp. MB52-C2]|uniref:phage terminase large subunit family protein n=1 Tax=Tissierella sp. MB52-C2 TaxID=3070999 RepID=UPI00280BB1FA|nr:hypothetical protein [Tissierella sp. MB52-C2]WMM26671.1 hypothetical protein RBU61_08330 [Tissierella sp. MB52-C2]
MLLDILSKIDEKVNNIKDTQLDLVGKDYIEKYLYIKTKDKELIPLPFNPIQSMYWGNKTKRDIILKPRQLGFTTLKVAEYFERIINEKNVTAVIIAHNNDSTQKIFAAVQLMYENLPEEKKLQLNAGMNKPKYGNRKEFYFVSNNSRISVGTAGNTSFGRGDTINYLHCSEVAFWPNPEELTTGLFQAVPFDGEICLETTANGVGNYFYRTYQEAKTEKSIWTNHFYRWFDHPEYKLKLDPGEKLELDDEEQRLIDTYNLSLEQIKWRRWKISEMPDKDGLTKEDMFKQEYPEDEQSCFLTSGRPVFDIKVLMEIRRKLEGIINYKEYSIDHAAEIKYRLNEYDDYEIDFNSFIHEKYKGELKVYEEPNSDLEYVMGSDVAEGKDGGDYSVAIVIEKETGRQVAELHGHWEPDIFAKKIKRLGLYYNNAAAGVERNNHGHAVLNTLINYDIYDNLYNHVKYNSATGEEEKEPGFPTNKQTKPILVSDLQEGIRERYLDIQSMELVDELITFVNLDGGKMGAQEGCHDDRVMALGIALQVRKHTVVDEPFYVSSGDRR